MSRAGCFKQSNVSVPAARDVGVPPARCADILSAQLGAVSAPALRPQRGRGFWPTTSVVGKPCEWCLRPVRGAGAFPQPAGIKRPIATGPKGRLVQPKATPWDISVPRSCGPERDVHSRRDEPTLQAGDLVTHSFPGAPPRADRTGPLGRGPVIADGAVTALPVGANRPARPSDP